MLDKLLLSRLIAFDQSPQGTSRALAAVAIGALQISKQHLHANEASESLVRLDIRPPPLPHQTTNPLWRATVSRCS